ncbi:YesL family protein [Microbacterium hibisci]|uniref:YesL family protein n=1 Tax=Microbacterium hibisci TaxID=2036000 RepID=UPI00194056B3|nr:DUF624 domain-containing protein [Microbacterium hibisci]
MTNSGTPTWALRAHAAFDWIWWIVVVNALWWFFTLAGAVVLGAIPASVAAAEVTRRRLRGELFPVARTFASAWRREFWRANGALGAGAIATCALAASVAGQLGAGSLASFLGVVSAVALAAAFAITTIAAVMYAHYDLALRAYLPTAGRWAVRNVPHVVLLLLGAVVVTAAGSILPGMIPFLSVGGWLVLSTTMCFSFFTANDRAVEAASTAP